MLVIEAILDRNRARDRLAPEIVRTRQPVSQAPRDKHHHYGQEIEDKPEFQHASGAN